MFYKEMYIDVPFEYEKYGLNREECKAIIVNYVTDISPEIGRHNRPAVLICPGGGYDFVSDREGEPIAMELVSKGIQCFVLKYCCVKKPFPLALLQAAAALAYIRKNAYDFDINPDDITVMGFSAGGHLAASLAVHWNKDFVKKPFGFTTEHKPNALVLCYPVISVTDTHQGSIDNLLCADNSEKNKNLISLEKNVSADTPKTFIWHCADDGCVPVSNSLRFAAALNENKIPFALHIFEKGDHGLALANEVSAIGPNQINEDAADWMGLCIKWIYNK